MASSTKNRIDSIIINQEWCKRCGICVSFCPKKVFEEDDEGTVSIPRPEDCIYCELCERLCPDLAITLVPKPQDSGDPS
ncbi:MAG: ferredoxin family protein [Spirochaetaceae bacterium]|nr:MAG: ferredoxin family protein [Spirochaetaceae bacterium]